ncbi:MAG TPA: DUF72 domain-containing protein [Sumerlaeia bacterium]|nr:DUF72 domain-containing protein [Sumerlaeia bacterium]
MTVGECYVGTSGWSYSHWAKGRFYPKGLKQGEWLRFYSERFPTVEVNSSFYRIPKLEFISRWRELTDPRFRFAVKLWRRITHEKRLAKCAQDLADFLSAVAPLQPKLGPLLVQLPPSLKCDIDLLESFLSGLEKVERTSKTAERRGPLKATVEFRNKDWLNRQTHELLDRHNASLCLSDLPKCSVAEPNRAGFVYIRRHGPGGDYRGRYPAEAIAEDAARIRGWIDEGRDVYVYFNNDIDGYAVDNARQLIERLE